MCGGLTHHGYIPRMDGGHRGRRPGARSVQGDFGASWVNLLRGGKPVAMSTRAGEFVTLKDVLQEVGSDAARFLFLTPGL